VSCANLDYQLSQERTPGIDLVKEARAQLSVAYSELFKEAAALANQYPEAIPEGLQFALSLVEQKRREFAETVAGLAQEDRRGWGHR